MKQTSVLFIGGLKHGSRIVVPWCTYFRTPSDISSLREDNYTRRRLVVPLPDHEQRVVYYFAHESLDDDTAFEQLLDFIDEQAV